MAKGSNYGRLTPPGPGAGSEPAPKKPRETRETGERLATDGDTPGDVLAVADPQAEHVGSVIGSGRETVPVDAICTGCKTVRVHRVAPECTVGGGVSKGRTFEGYCRRCGGMEYHNVRALLRGLISND